MLRQYARRTNLAGVYTYQGDNPAVYWGLDVANTDEPSGFTLPQYLITIQKRNPPSFLGKVRKALDSIHMGSDPYDIYAQLNLTANADPGTNDAVYLGAGIYDTNGTIDLPSVRSNVGLSPMNYAKTWTTGKLRIYLVVENAEAKKNRDAENEHLADFIYAYNRTLAVAQNAFVALRNRWFGPFDEESDALQAVEDAFLENVPAELKHLGMKMNLWGQEYLRLCQKSRIERDGRGWHSFGVQVIHRSSLPKHIHPSYLTGVKRPDGGRVYIKLVSTGTQIGSHSSASIITYG